MEFEGQALLFCEVQKIVDEVHEHGGAVTARLKEVICLSDFAFDSCDLLLVVFQDEGPLLLEGFVTVGQTLDQPPAIPESLDVALN